MAYWWGAKLVPKPKNRNVFKKLICLNLRAEQYWFCLFIRVSVFSRFRAVAPVSLHEREIDSS